MSERLGRVCLLVVAAAMATAAATYGAAAATRIDCPAQVVYRFQFSDAILASETAAHWQVNVHRGEGERSVGLPQLYTRNNELICEYQLPNGAFALVKRPRPDGMACTAGADDALSVPYFACE